MTSSYKNFWQDYGKAWADRNKDKIAEGRKRRYRTRRKLAIEKMGSRCVCDGTDCWHVGPCVASDIRVLQFNHKNGDGYKERAARGGNHSIRLVTEILRDERTDIELFCANCNWVHRYKFGLYPGAFDNPHVKYPRRKPGPKKGSHQVGYPGDEEVKRRKAEYMKKWSAEHKEQKAAYMHDYYRANKEKWVKKAS